MTILTCGDLIFKISKRGRYWEKSCQPCPKSWPPKGLLCHLDKISGFSKQFCAGCLRKHDPPGLERHQKMLLPRVGLSPMQCPRGFLLQHTSEGPQAVSEPISWPTCFWVTGGGRPKGYWEVTMTLKMASIEKEMPFGGPPTGLPPLARLPRR